MSYVDEWVHGGSIRLSTRDYGGAGRPILLLHGAGRSLADWLPMVPELTRHHRVVAMDLRGHGLSEAGIWTVPSLLADIEAVLQHYSLPTAALVGHSMGGVLAHLFAAAHIKTTAVINFDGFSLRSDEHPDLAPADVKESRARAISELIWSYSYSCAELEKEAELWGDDRKQIAQRILRRLVTQRDDGRYHSRDEKETSDGFSSLYQVHLEQNSLFEAIWNTKAKLLLLCSNSSTDLENTPEWCRQMLSSYHVGLERNLSALAQSERARVEFTDAGHYMIFEQPEMIAQQVISFLTV